MRVDVEHHTSAWFQQSLQLLVEGLCPEFQRHSGFIRGGGRFQERVHVNCVVFFGCLFQVVKGVGDDQSHVAFLFDSEVAFGQFHDDRVNFYRFNIHLRIIFLQEVDHGSAPEAHDDGVLLFRLKQIIGEHVLQVTEPQYPGGLQVDLALISFFSGIPDKDQRSNAATAAYANVRIRRFCFHFDGAARALCQRRCGDQCCTAADHRQQYGQMPPARVQQSVLRDGRGPKPVSPQHSHIPMCRRLRECRSEAGCCRRLRCEYSTDCGQPWKDSP